MVALEGSGRRLEETYPSDGPALDADSLTVSSVAERLIPSVASLRVTRARGGWLAAGAG
ncbi:MAG: hypothetical protein ACLQHS_10315 [Candidatus Limnocylindrales bacterium]|jgi:hypothetical protein